MDFSHSGEPELSDDVRFHLFRVAQEALRNSLRHARASRVEVVLEPTDSGLLLQVDDDGTGYRPDHEREGHFGLANMGDRLALLGGELELIGPRPDLGRGTRLLARLWRK